MTSIPLIGVGEMLTQNMITMLCQSMVYTMVVCTATPLNWPRVIMSLFPIIIKQNYGKTRWWIIIILIWCLITAVILLNQGAFGLDGTMISILLISIIATMDQDQVIATRTCIKLIVVFSAEFMVVYLWVHMPNYNLSWLSILATSFCTAAHVWLDSAVVLYVLTPLLAILIMITPIFWVWLLLWLNLVVCCCATPHIRCRQVSKGPGKLNVERSWKTSIRRSRASNIHTIAITCAHAHSIAVVLQFVRRWKTPPDVLMEQLWILIILFVTLIVLAVWFQIPRGGNIKYGTIPWWYIGISFAVTDALLQLVGAAELTHKMDVLTTLIDALAT